MRSPRRLRWITIPVALGLAIALAGCSQQQLRGYMPGEPGITNHTDDITGLWVTSWTILLAIGLLVWGLIIWTMVVYRRRKGQTGLPVQLRYNLPIEIFYTIVPLIFILGFFSFTARDQAKIETPVDSQVQVQVFGKRWAWDFNYQKVGPNGDGVYYQGVQAKEIDEPPYIDEDALPVLYLPVGKTVDLTIDSRDVVHSFWVPEFLYKKDMIPGKTNHIYFTPLKEGVYMGKCAELCGEYHSLMLFKVKVVSESEFEAYINSLAAKGQTGALGSEYNTNTNIPGNKPSTGNE
ncbi:MAG: cytochrome c oxidase subunit II [Terrimesophilobacter sp.]